MNGQVNATWKKYLRDLKKQGLTQEEIVKKTGRSKGMVSRAVKGLKDQREMQGKPPKNISLTNPKKDVGNAGNTDQKHIPDKPQRRGKGNVGVKVILLLGFVILILILLDRLLLHGKILDEIFEKMSILFETEQTDLSEQSKGISPNFERPGSSYEDLDVA